MLVLLVPAVVGVIALATSGSSRPEPLGPIRGMRLGFAPSQARQHLSTGQPGSFSTTTQGEDFALVWTPEGVAGDLRSARLEFHLGQLVALRLELRSDAPEASGPPLEVSGASVLARRPATDGHVMLTWLSRSCPTHAAEVRRLLPDPTRQ